MNPTPPPPSIGTTADRSPYRLTLDELDAALQIEFDDHFVRRGWGDTRWRELIDEVQPIDGNQTLIELLGAVAAIEDDAFYMQHKIRATGLLRFPSIEAYNAVWLTEETDHGRAFDALNRRLSGGAMGGNKPGHGTLGRDPRAIIALPAMRLVSSYRRGVLAGYLVRGALVEHVAIVIYGALKRELMEAGEPAGSEIVRRILIQEGRHLRFFSRSAKVVLGASPAMAKAVRRVTETTWRPPGVDLYGRADWAELFRPVLTDPGNLEAIRSVDDKMGEIPGFSGATIVRDYLEGVFGV